MFHTTGLDGRIEAVSDYWLDKMGYEREEVVGVPAMRFLTEASRKDAEECIPRTFETGFLAEERLDFVRKDGRIWSICSAITGPATFASCRTRSNGRVGRSAAVVVPLRFWASSRQRSRRGSKRLASTNARDAEPTRFRRTTNSRGVGPPRSYRNDKRS